MYEQRNVHNTQTLFIYSLDEFSPSYSNDDDTISRGIGCSCGRCSRIKPTQEEAQESNRVHSDANLRARETIQHAKVPLAARSRPHRPRALALHRSSDHVVPEPTCQAEARHGGAQERRDRRQDPQTNRSRCGRRQDCEIRATYDDEWPSSSSSQFVRSSIQI